MPAAPDRARGERGRNAVEGFFAKRTRRRLQRGVFHSLVDLPAAIHRYRAEHNRAPTPFVCTAEPEAILAKVRSGHHMLETIQYHHVSAKHAQRCLTSFAWRFNRRY